MKSREKLHVCSTSKIMVNEWNTSTQLIQQLPLCLQMRCQSINNACRMKTRHKGIASGRSRSFFTAKKKKKIFAFFFARASLFVFYKKKQKKSWRAYVSTIKRIVCIIYYNFAVICKIKLPTRPVGRIDCNYLSSRRFEPPSRSKFIIFQGEHRGLEIKILISGAPKSLVPGFHTTCVI